MDDNSHGSGSATTKHDNPSTRKEGDFHINGHGARPTMKHENVDRAMAINSFEINGHGGRSAPPDHGNNVSSSTAKQNIVKVTDPGVIAVGEKELIDTLKEDLNWDAVKEVIADKVTRTHFSATGGEIVVHDGEIAFKVELEARVTLSLLFDRQGNYIEAGETLPKKEKDRGEKEKDRGDKEKDRGDKEKDRGDDDDDDDKDGNAPLPLESAAIDGDDLMESVPNNDKIAGDPDGDTTDGLDDAFDEVLSLPDDEEEPEEMDGDEDLDALLKESREYWVQKNG